MTTGLLRCIKLKDATPKTNINLLFRLSPFQYIKKILYSNLDSLFYCRAYYTSNIFSVYFTIMQEHGKINRNISSKKIEKTHDFVA